MIEMSIFIYLNLLYFIPFIIYGHDTIFHSNGINHHLILPPFYNETKITNLIPVDIKNYRSTSKITYEYDRHSDSHIFTPRPPYLIDVVTNGNRIIWDSADHGNQYGIQVFVGYDEHAKHIFRVYFQGDFGSYTPQSHTRQRNTRSKQSHRHESHHSTGDLVILNLKNRHNTRTVHYEFNSRKNIHTFTALHPNLFGLVLKGKKTVWQGYGLAYPDVVVLFPKDGGGYVMRVSFPSDHFHPVHKPAWFPPVEDSKHVEEDESSSADQPVTATTHLKPITCYIGFRFTTPFFYYSTYNNTSTFTARGRYTFCSVKHLKGINVFGSDGLIWKAGNPDEYAKTIELDTLNKKLIIYLGDGTTAKVYKLVNKNWLEDPNLLTIDKPQLKTVQIDLDIHSRQSTQYYHFIDACSCQDRFRQTYVFLPKHSTKFNSVVDGDETIWKSHGLEHPTKVTMIRFTGTNTRQVSIHFGFGLTKRFIKSPSQFFQKKAWREECV